MTSLPTIPTTSYTRLPLVLTTPSRALVASNLLVYLVLGQNIVYILYSKYTSLTNIILFSPPTLGKCFVRYSKYTYLGS